MKESVLDRPAVGKLNLEQVAHIALFAIAFVLGCYQLGPRPYHHDESIHAFYSWKISEGDLTGYRYDPVYHGTVLYYAAGLVMKLFGDNDFTGRLSAVLFGLGVLAFAWPLRRYLGRWGALTFAALMTFSPSWLYFARFVRHDVYLALCTIGAVYFAFRYGETRKFWYLPLSAFFLGVGFATKEDSYFLTVIYLIAFAGTLVWEVIGAPDDKRSAVRGQVWGEVLDLFKGIPLALLASAVAFLVPWVLFYTGFFQNSEYWDPKAWSAFFNLFEPIPDAIHYWTGQHGVERIGGPWWYYIPQLTLYEPLLMFSFVALLFGPFLSVRPRGNLDQIFRYLAFLTLAFLFVLAVKPEWGTYKISHGMNVKVGTATMAGMFAIAMFALCRVWVPDRFIRFCVLWTIGVLLIYSWAQEKVPWLLVPQVLPLLLLAGRFYGEMIESGKLTGGRLAGFAVTGAYTVWALINVNYIWDAPRPAEPGARLDPPKRHGEMLAYVQSTYDIHMVMDHITRTEQIIGGEQGRRIACGGDATWPFSWYLRRYPVNWAQSPREIDYPVVIVDKKDTVQRSFDKALLEKYEKIPFQIRGWWVWEDKFPENLTKFVKWLLLREAWSGTGSSDAVLYLIKNPTPGMKPDKILVNPPPAAIPWGSIASPITPVAVWGHEGSEPGEFKEPRGMALDAAGNLYVADTKNHRIQKLGSNGAVIKVWGSEGDKEGQFKDPHSVAIGPDGNVYVADTWNHKVVKFDANGNFIARWGDGLWGPRGIAVHPDGSVFITDTGNKLVKKFTAGGQFVKDWGGDGSEPGQFIEPVGIVIDPQGRVVVADTGNHRLQFFTADGVFVQQWRVRGWEEFYTEPYIAVLGGHVLATDSHENRFGRYKGDNDVVDSWGRPGAGNGEFKRPIGIVAAPDGTVYVTDTMNHRIQKFQLPAQ